MVDLVQVAGPVLFIMVSAVILLKFTQLKRKYDFWCFLLGYYISLLFFLLVFYALLIGRFELLPEIMSSAVIALLTLAFVWVELSKRPELKLLDFVPITHIVSVPKIWKVGENTGKLSNPSRFLGIREAIDVAFSQHTSFCVDVANVGYEEIMTHEYVVFIDGTRRPTQPLLSESNALERLTLKTQQRHTINMDRLYLDAAGLHKIRLEVYATTVMCSKEVWFFISDDFKKLRYVEMFPLKRLLSPLIKNKLKDP